MIAGCAVDFGFTFAASAALALGYAWLRAVDFETARTQPEFLLPLLSLGALGTVMGAALAARIARSRPLAHGLFVGGVSTAMGLVALFGGQGSVPEPWNWIGLAAALPASLLGALLGSPRDS